MHSPVGRSRLVFTVILYMHSGSCMDVAEMIFHLLNIVGMFVHEDILERWLDFLEMISIWNWRYYYLAVH